METLQPSAQDLPALVTQAAKEAFSGNRLTEALRGGADQSGSFRSATTIVKSVFGDLGHKLGFKVAASGYPLAEGGEWLYDMCWFTDTTDILLRIGLVLETEMKPGGSVINAVYVDTDFQKIVQAKADVRVWFCAIPNEEMVKLHIAGCQRQIDGFAGSRQVDRYIIILYNWTSGLTTVECIGE